MRLLTIGHQLYRANGSYWTDTLTADLFTQFVQYFDNVVVAGLVRPKEGEDFHTNTPVPLSVQVVDLGQSGGLAGLLSMRQARNLAEALRKTDYVHMLTGHMAVKVYLLIRTVTRRPFCVYERGHWMDREQIKARFRGTRRLSVPVYVAIMSRLRRAMLKAAHVVYVHGDQLLRECLAVRRGNGVEDVVPLLPLEEHHFFQRADTCAGGRATLLYVGGVGGKKGVEYLLEAVGRLRARGHNVELRMITKVPLLPKQERIVDALCLRDRVRVAVGLPWQQVIQAYRDVDVLVVPSLSEGFPRVIYEGLTQSVPIVATAVGGVPALIRDGESALVVEPYSADSLSRAIEQLLTDQELRRRLIRNGFKVASALFGPGRRFRSHAEQVRVFAERGPLVGD